MEPNSIQEYARQNFDLEITVRDMDQKRFVLFDGFEEPRRAFHEVCSNIWKEEGANAAYLNTVRHNGGIMLRLIFVKIDGSWLNVMTGHEAPFPSAVLDG